uniref:Uncharacterized protein n=1 Tax=Wuchereria bancrofti TaxID=6293 RepID=A0AAF5PUZ6_WUCBA
MLKLSERLQSRLYNTWPRYKNIGFITLYIATLLGSIKYYKSRRTGTKPISD